MNRLARSFTDVSHSFLSKCFEEMLGQQHPVAANALTGSSEAFSFGDRFVEIR